jgi:hypothetical protein
MGFLVTVVQAKKPKRYQFLVSRYQFVWSVSMRLYLADCKLYTYIDSAGFLHSELKLR